MRDRPLHLPRVSVDCLFSANLPPDMVRDIPLADIDPFPSHPFKVVNDLSMKLLAESIRDTGVQTPAVVRRKDDGRYELVSGHRRKVACELAGLLGMPCVVRELTFDAAVIAMVDANLQRETILPSEKAKSYKMRLEAMKRQAGRPANNSVPLAQNFDGRTSREILGEAVGESQDQVRRFIRLNDLIPALLDMVDEGGIKLQPAVEVSYLTAAAQELLLKFIRERGVAPSGAQAEKLRELDCAGGLTEFGLASVMDSKEKPAKAIKISRTSLTRFFAPDTPAAEVEKTIVAALEYYLAAV